MYERIVDVLCIFIFIFIDAILLFIVKINHIWILNQILHLHDISIPNSTRNYMRKNYMIHPKHEDYGNARLTVTEYH